MSFITIATPNTKGQIVIPKKIRDFLHISQETLLKISLIGESICFTPITNVLTQAETEDSYLKILEKTQGSWHSDAISTAEKKRRKIELLASKKRKTAW